MKGLKKLVPLLGAIPLPGNMTSAKNFLNAIKKRVKKGSSITIYPEAHIWPYYTKIRPFKETSFQYPVELNVPIFTLTTTYHAGTKEGSVKIISYIDGPFFPDLTLGKREAKKQLHEIALKTMQKRSEASTFEYVIYRKK